MIQHITNAEIVAKNREAIRNKTLGAIVGSTKCMYSYDRDDRVRCAIGACLTDTTMSIVRRRHLNGMPVNSLADRDIVTAENLQLARFTQRIHDMWNILNPRTVVELVHYDLTTVEGPPFPEFVKPRLDRLIDETLFTEWLDYIEENHL